MTSARSCRRHSVRTEFAGNARENDRAMAVTVISGFLTERTRAVFGDRVVIPRDDAIAAIPGVRMKGPSADVGIFRPELRQLARQDESSGEVPTVLHGR